jgi:O-acetyl-ADP-ribose deacetylase
MNRPSQLPSNEDVSPGGRVLLVGGDLCGMTVDAIVVAADETLIRGTGVAAAVLRAAGPELARHCATLPLSLPGVRCRPGAAVLTPGFGLATRNVIHTVAPVYVSGEQGEPDILANCYRSALRLAVLANLKSVAFAALGCGARAFPIDEAAAIAVATVRDESARNVNGPAVTLVAFNGLVHGALRRALAQGSGEHRRY